MDSKDLNVEKSSDHQSTTEQNVVQDGSNIFNSNESLKEEPTIESVPDTKAENVTESQLSLSSKTLEIPEEISVMKTETKMATTETSSGSLIISSSATSIQEVKQMTKRQLATVITLCFVNLLKYMDRFTIAGILTDIQEDFGIDDAQGGLLSTAFVVSYMLFSPVFGYLGDRFSRKIIMAVGIAFWSLSTLAGSFTTTYGLFLTSRILVGIGEAMFSTVSPTIISDVCVGDTRSKFLILYYFAIPVGSGLGFIVGALMASAFGGWEWGLRITPILGAIAVLLVIFVVQEPPRGEAEGSNLSTTTYWDDLKYLAKNKSYVLSTGGCTLVTYVSGALAWWGPKFITLGLATTQGQDASYTQVSLIVGLEAGLAGVLGISSGSLLGQKLRKRYPTADPLVCAWTMIACAPVLYWGIFIASGPAVPTYIVLFFGQWLMNMNWAPVGDILLYVVIPTRRSTAEAFSILVSHALGDAGSPYITGVISDSFKESFSNSYPSYETSSADVSPMARDDSASFIDPETVLIDFKALQYSLFLTTIIAGLSAVFFFANAWYIVEDKAKVDKAVKEYDDAKRLDRLEQQQLSKLQSTEITDIKPDQNHEVTIQS